jgi:hypothetical protein
MKNVNLKSLKVQVKKLAKVAKQHAVFGVIMAVLLTYLFMIWRINSLAGADISAEDQSAALSQAHLPKVDKKAIAQIQALEDSNTQIKSFFNNARNNPFQE